MNPKGWSGNDELIGSGLGLILLLVVIVSAALFAPRNWVSEHHGHKWIENRHGGIAHHPDCPCKKAEVEK